MLIRGGMVGYITSISMVKCYTAVKKEFGAVLVELRDFLSLWEKQDAENWI